MRPGITVSSVPELSTHQCLADIKERKVDSLPAGSLFPERHAYFSFSNDLIRIPRVIISWVAQGYQGMLAVEAGRNSDEASF
jgi:ABC-type amino acid transport substrate-binding protein